MRRPLELVHVSDTHLAAPGGAGDAVRSTRRDQACRGWGWFVEQLRADPPDVVVHTGDVVLDDPDDDADRRHAHDLLARLDVPLLVVPGNHDVGDRPDRTGLPPGWLGPIVSTERIARWNTVWGDGHWAHEAGDWLLLGVTSSLMGTGLDGEDDQWDWLRARLHSATGEVALFLHETPVPALHGLDADSWAAVPAPAQARLASLLDRYPVRLVGNGHLHRFHVATRGATTYVTAPSLASAIPDHPDMTRPAGDPTTGFLRYTLTPHDVTLRAVRNTGPAIDHLPR